MYLQNILIKIGMILYYHLPGTCVYLSVVKITII